MRFRFAPGGLSIGLAAGLAACAPSSSPASEYRVSTRHLELPPGGPCVPALSQFPGRAISPLPCRLVKVSAPFSTDFAAAETGLLDAAAHGLGFTMVLPSSNGVGYLPADLSLDPSRGELAITTTAGIGASTLNTQDNALGVGLELPNANLRIATTLSAPAEGSNNYEQAGLWFGISDADYFKLVLQSAPSGNVVQALLEQADVIGRTVNRALAPPLARLELALELRPAQHELRAYAHFDPEAPEELIATFSNLPDAWFNTDGAGIDFTVGTRSFAGIFATHRRRPAALGPVEYRFSSFSVSAFEDTGETFPSSPDPVAPTPVEPSGPVDFTRFSVAAPDPTALAFAPDGRLYVGSVTGAIHALRIDYERGVLLEDQLIGSLADRLLLGLTVDPSATPDDVILWASHSDVAQGSGAANSGVISRLSGPGLARRQDVIVGLPRAIANHSTNNLRFGPDGRLYISQGGNTGAGAANDGTSEFGPRPEQPLSAALLVADVKGPNFDGNCLPTVDADGVLMDATGIAAHGVPCSVEVYASGLRNSFDAVFHSNGQLYATDNALGVEGTFPDLGATPLSFQPALGCEGPVLGTAAVNSHNPGTRRDLLLRVEAGAYYGHPNPSRGECRFYAANPSSAADGVIPQSGGGTTALELARYPVGVEPEPRYRPAMFSFGEHKSADGIIEYRSDAFCGALKGDLLVTYYSTDDQIHTLTLSADGTRVVAEGTLPRSTAATGGADLRDPLPLTQDAAGRIYVGEFGADRVTIFNPIRRNCAGAALSERGASRQLHAQQNGQPARQALFSGDPGLFPNGGWAVCSR